MRVSLGPGRGPKGGIDFLTCRSVVLRQKSQPEGGVGLRLTEGNAVEGRCRLCDF